MGAYVMMIRYAKVENMNVFNYMMTDAVDLFVSLLDYIRTNKISERPTQWEWKSTSKHWYLQGKSETKHAGVRTYISRYLKGNI